MRVQFDGVVNARSKLMVAQDANKRAQRSSLEVKGDVFVATWCVVARLAFSDGLDSSYVVEYQLGDKELRRGVGGPIVEGLNGRASIQSHDDGGQGEGKGNVNLVPAWSELQAFRSRSESVGRDGPVRGAHMCASQEARLAVLHAKHLMRKRIQLESIAVTVRTLDSRLLTLQPALWVHEHWT